jgi:hypothetical protein
VNQDHTILVAERDGNAVLPKLNLAYEPTVGPDGIRHHRQGLASRRLQSAHSAAHGQTVLADQSGAYNCGVGAVIPVSSQPNYSPDSVWSAEIGEKARFADRRITVNADFYYIKWDNIQQVLSLTCGYPYNTNAGNAKSYGPELEMSALLTTGLTFDCRAPSPRPTSATRMPAPWPPASRPGTRVLNVPKYTAVAGLNYQLPINDQLNGMFHLASSLVGPNQDQAAVRQTCRRTIWSTGAGRRRQRPLVGGGFRHQPDQQSGGADHQQHGLRLADLCDHPRVDQPAAHHRSRFPVQILDGRRYPYRGLAYRGVGAPACQAPKFCKMAGEQPCWTDGPTRTRRGG